MPNRLTSDELKTSGSRKFKRAQSSWRLFWRGVPVRRSLLVHLNSLTYSDNLDFSFFIRWASSIIK